MQAILRDMNFEVCEIASDCESGLELSVRHEAELLLVDVNLGDGPDGIEAVRGIRQYLNVAVIFITAYTEQATMTRIRSLAPEAPVLSKPVSPETLQAAMRRLFPGI